MVSWNIVHGEVHDNSPELAKYWFSEAVSNRLYSYLECWVWWPECLLLGDWYRATKLLDLLVKVITDGRIYWSDRVLLRKRMTVHGKQIIPFWELGDTSDYERGIHYCSHLRMETQVYFEIQSSVKFCSNDYVSFIHVCCVLLLWWLCLA